MGTTTRARGRLALALLGVAAAVGAATLPGAGASAGATAVPTGTRPKPPQNVVLILTDDQSPESLKAMPFTNGRKDWVRFSRAYFNFPLCCVSRATILSGRYSHHHHVESNSEGHKLDERSTLATWLDRKGYRTALIGKYLNQYPWNRGSYVPPGWDDWHAFLNSNDVEAAYYNYALNENGRTVRYGSAPSDYSTDVLARKAVDFIEQARGQQPFFLYFAPITPHKPYLPAPRHKGAYAKLRMPRSPSFNEGDVSDKPPAVRSLPKQSPAKMDNDRRAEYEMLLSADEAIKKIFGALSANRILDNTVVIFLTDNGYMFGEHRIDNKSYLYEEAITTPFLVRYPGAKPRVANNLVSNVDVAPTIAHVAGAHHSAVDGRSLVPLLKGAARSWRADVLLRWKSSKSSLWGVRTDSWKYVEWSNGDRELYDLKRDPFELANRAGQPGLARVQSDLARRLVRLRQS